MACLFVQKEFFFEYKQRLMKPLHSIAYSLGTFFVIILLFSNVSNQGQEIISERICPVVEEAYNQCLLPQQDKSISQAISHSSKGLGMIEAVRGLVSDDAVKNTCNIDPAEVKRICTKYHHESLNYVLQQNAKKEEAR